MPFAFAFMCAVMATAYWGQRKGSRQFYSDKAFGDASVSEDCTTRVLCFFLCFASNWELIEALTRDSSQSITRPYVGAEDIHRRPQNSQGSHRT